MYVYVIICILYDTYILFGNVCVCNYLYPVWSICTLLKWHLLYIMSINSFSLSLSLPPVRRYYTTQRVYSCDFGNVDVPSIPHQRVWFHKRQYKWFWKSCENPLLITSQNEITNAGRKMLMLNVNNSFSFWFSLIANISATTCKSEICTRLTNSTKQNLQLNLIYDVIWREVLSIYQPG